MPKDLAEFAVRQVKETMMCMKLDVLGWGGAGAEMMNRLFLGNSVIF